MTVAAYSNELDQPVTSVQSSKPPNFQKYPLVPAKTKFSSIWGSGVSVLKLSKNPDSNKILVSIHSH